LTRASARNLFPVCFALPERCARGCASYPFPSAKLPAFAHESRSARGSAGAKNCVSPDRLVEFHGRTSGGRHEARSGMRDPFYYSVPMGRLFGVAIRIHWLFPFVALGLILKVAYKEGTPPGLWVDYTMLLIALFFAVLLHEFGHCFGARHVNGDASEVLLW